jgi:stage III sporulation protein AC
MNIDFVFKIAAIGIIVAVLDQVLRLYKRDEMATMTSLAGLIIVLIMVVGQIAKLFSTIKSVFGL